MSSIYVPQIRIHCVLFAPDRPLLEPAQCPIACLSLSCLLSHLVADLRPWDEGGEHRSLPVFAVDREPAPPHRPAISAQGPGRSVGLVDSVPRRPLIVPWEAGGRTGSLANPVRSGR